MDEGQIEIVGITLASDGIELIVNDTRERRQGLAVAHSYFVEYSGEVFGSRANDVRAEIQELAEDVHFGWKRAPKEPTHES